MSFFIRVCERNSRRAACGAIATAALVFSISSCANLDIRSDRISSGGLTETPEDKAALSRGGNGAVSNGGGRFTLAAAADTISSIARRFGVEADELARLNGKHPFEPLSEGAVIVLPESAGSIAETVEESPARTNEMAVEQIRYRVRRGDTAFSIARNFGVSARIVAEWNDLGPGFEVREDQVLLIPVPRNSSAGDVAFSDQISDGTIPSSASDPLPEHPAGTELPPSPQLEQYRTAAGKDSKLLIPVNGEIINGYTGAGGNEGIDIAAIPGTTVRAADEGTVALVTRATDQTIILLLRHQNDLYTVYSNLQQTELEQNDSVIRGQPIGRSAGGDPPYVHFEVRIGANSVDPVTYL